MRWFWAHALLCLGLLACSTRPANADTDCKELLQEYYKANTKEAVPYTGSNMVYFLHIPRTAGRTFYSCLLRIGTPGRRRCPKAYDHLRINTELPQCYLLSSHDDFSVVESLPPETAVVSQLRDPVQRVLSAYEFAIEVAARQLRRSKNYVKPKNRVVTDDVWPWSYLIPFFVNDMKPKITALKAEPLKAPGVWAEQRADDGRRYYWNKFANTSKWELTPEEKEHLVPNLDSYNNPLVMSLEDFIRNPIATELLHNGELLQVLGLTNYSHWDKAAEMRQCMLKDNAIAEELLQFGLKRIERFEHVGTTEKLMPSVESAAASLKMPLGGTAYGAGEAADANVEASRSLTWQDAMKAGDTPVPPAEDDVYADNGAKADIHQLAAAVRKRRLALSQLQQRWNELVKSKASQTELRGLRGELNAARAEVTVAQSDLVAVRTEEARKRELKAEQSKTDKTLGQSLGAEFQKCAKRAQTRNLSRKKTSMLNLRLNDYRQVYFDKEDRKRIPEAVIEEIRKLNALDVRLHQRSLEMLQQRRQQLAAAGSLQALPPVLANTTNTTASKDEL